MAVSENTFLPSRRPTANEAFFGKTGRDQRTKVCSFRILCDELGTFLHDLGHFDQYILCCIDLRWRSVFQDECVSSSDSNIQFYHGCVQICLRQNQLLGITLIDGTENDGYILWRTRSTQTAPFERMGESIHDRESKFAHSFWRTYITDAGDNGIESSKWLKIC